MPHRLPLRIVDKIRETPRAATIVFEAPADSFHYRAGQFLTFIFADPVLGEVRRSYSLSSAPGIDPLPAITVQQQPNGLVSRHFVEQAQIGAMVEALSPAGSFTLEPQGDYGRDVFLIGGGSGITPLFSILKLLLFREPQSRVILLLTNRDEHSIIFRRQLRRLATDYQDQFHCEHILSSPEAAVLSLRQEEAPARVRWARLSNAMVEELVGQYLRFPAGQAEFFLCGPPPLMIKVENALGYLGFESRQIHREIFTVKKPFRPSTEDFPASRVDLRYHGEQYTFPVAPGQTILEAAAVAGIELPYSCRSGICNTCAGRCRQGKVEMFTQEGRLSTETSDGLVLTCVGYPTTGKVDVVI